MERQIFGDMLDRIEHLCVELGRTRQDLDAARTQLANFTHGPGIRPQDVEDMVRAMAAGRKIDAIKGYRLLTGTGLKEAKDAVESVTNLRYPITPHP